ncbi:SPOR domain-containing protein [Salinivirga cyanobacteriivorans]
MIDKYIAELLKTNTRVIVPDFGAFMVKSSPGSTEKQVSFNDFLKYNDGLLINHIAKKESIVKEEAQKKVKAFVDDIQKELKANKPFKIADLGYLYKDPRGSVRFKAGDEKPEEQKATATAQSATSVKLDEKEKSAPKKKEEPKVEKKEEPAAKKADAGGAAGKTLNEKLSDKKDSKTQVKTGAPEAKKATTEKQQPKPGGSKVPPGKKPPATQQPKKANNSSVAIITAAIVVVLGAGAVIAYLNWDTVQGWFGGSIFGKDEPREVAVDSAAIKAKQARMDSIRMAQARQDSIEQARQDSIRKAEEMKKKNQKKYYLVAGSFKNKKYADMFVEKLNGEGYNSEVFMERRGFYRVSFNSYVDRQKAFNEYRRMKNQDIQVWVLRH